MFTLQTLPACEEPFDAGVGKDAGSSLHAGVAARADERKKLERLCCYISRPAISEKRLSHTPNGKVRYDVKGFTSPKISPVFGEPACFAAVVAPAWSDKIDGIDRERA